MKVGTDGVLLGAWARLDDARLVLDIGTGTGLIALMAAQRNAEAAITALEIDADAAAQASENVAATPWAGRITVVHADARTYVPGRKYDAIVSNPPYFSNALKSPDSGRAQARHADSLTFDELLACVVRCLAADGEFSVVIPAASAPDMIASAAGHGLYLSRRMWVRTLATAFPKRVLLAFRRGVGDVEERELAVEYEPKRYTPGYKELTKDFYLFF